MLLHHEGLFIHVVDESFHEVLGEASRTFRSLGEGSSSCFPALTVHLHDFLKSWPFFWIHPQCCQQLCSCQLSHVTERVRLDGCSTSPANVQQRQMPKVVSSVKSADDLIVEASQYPAFAMHHDKHLVSTFSFFANYLVSHHNPLPEIATKCANKVLATIFKELDLADSAHLRFDHLQVPCSHLFDQETLTSEVESQLLHA
mmetsp:Transcript_103395/g.183678  ORF Transcript_103395/g.183678 Transcript_103395/m.183678 type:complete len:201 (+) Transcript_103395:2444-3046(+)